MTTFAISKRDVETGQFPIAHLLMFSINTGARVLIRGYAEIINGEIKYLH